MKTVHGWIGILGMALVAALARGDDGWQFQVGGVHAWGMKMRSTGPAVVLPGDRYVGTWPGSDNILLFADRVFADGYVSLDISTTDPSVPAPFTGTTWNWGYEHADQYNAGTHTLSFHRETARSDEQSSGDEDFSATGLEVSAKRQLLSICGLDLGVDLALAWFPGAQASQSRSGSDLVQTYNYADPFQVVPTVPAPPYSGPADPLNGPGPIIPNLPVSVVSSVESYGVNTKADVNRLRAAVGPTLTLSVTEKLRVYAMPQLTLSLAHADVTRRQAITSTDVGTGASTVLSSSVASSDKTEFMAGVLLAVGVDYHFAKNWVIGAYVGREWIPEPLRVNVGADQTRLNFGGGEASLYVGMTF
ncbi:MAG: hypothetical protein ACOYOU_01895 [Kiritimatiellia bacterium]